jgi:hypothetical protein
MELTEIVGWSDSTPVFQRYGEIALGRKNEKGLPESVDYFVVPPEVIEFYGEKPTVLDIEFPSDDMQEFMPCGLFYYNYNKLLVCKGNGKDAAVKAAALDLDIELGKTFGIARKGNNFIAVGTGELLNTEKINEQEYVLHPCSYSKCACYKGNIEGRFFCHEAARLHIVLPKIPGRQLGVYTLETSSYNTYQNIRNGIGYFRRKYPGLPLWAVGFKLRLQMEVKHPEVGGKKQTTKPLPIVRLDFDMPIAEVLEIRKQHLEFPSKTMVAIRIEPVDDEKMPELLYGCAPDTLGESTSTERLPESPTGGDAETTGSTPVESPAVEPPTNAETPETPATSTKATSSGKAPKPVPFKGTIRIVGEPSAPTDNGKGVMLRVIEVWDQDGQVLKWLGTDGIIAPLKVGEVYSVEGIQAKDAIQVKKKVFIGTVAETPPSDEPSTGVIPEASGEKPETTPLATAEDTPAVPGTLAPETPETPETPGATASTAKTPAPAASTIEHRVVELANVAPKDATTNKGVFLSYTLSDGGTLMIPKNGPTPKPGTKLRVTGVNTGKAFWARTFEAA